MYNLNEILKEKKLSEMMKQYIECKLKYVDCIVLFRVGDFYELFYNDAIEISNKFEITLTSKACGLEEKAPMCGIPFHALDLYTPKFLKEGYKIAIVEQLTNPKDQKGLVKRDVIKIITPGTIVDEISNNNSNYLMSVYEKGDKASISYIDINQGDIYTTNIDRKFIREEISKVKPTEIIFNKLESKKEFIEIINDLFIFTNEEFNENYYEESIILNYFDKSFIDNLNFDENMIRSISILLNYIFYTQKRTNIANMNNIFIYDTKKYMAIDCFTRNSLELTKRLGSSEKDGTLFSCLDNTNTAMGSRLLKRFIEEPLVDKNEIEQRLNYVEDFYKDNLLRENISKILKKVYDLERLCSKIAYEKINAKELNNLKKSIEELPMLKHLIDCSNANNLKKLLKDFDDLIDLYKIIDEAILPNPSNLLNEGNIINPSFNKTLERYLNVLNGLNENLIKLEDSQKDITNIKSLKIRKNDIDGYYLEVTKKSIEGITLPDSYRKVRDLANACRYTFPELKELELNYLEASTKSTNLEYEIFLNIRSSISKNIARIKKTAKILSSIDVFVSLAEISFKYNYKRPLLNEEGIFYIKEGRHPIIERTIDDFIPNDIYMDEKEELIHIITGPNMAGKSTYMRQVVLINLMAQIGCFVPCEEANIPIRDKIFTRIGASDNLLKGQSTFMVEMNEVSQILNTASNKSLIILDEVGRGTSTYDGISLAWAIVEYIKDNIKCNTLFATHYFELTDLEEKYSNIKNYTIAIEEENNEVKFLRKIIKGYTNQSYGIYVAKFANIPDKVITRAKEILNKLEKEQKEENIANNINISTINNSLEEEILNLNLMNMNPMEVFNYLYNLQNKLKK